MRKIFTPIAHERKFRYIIAATHFTDSHALNSRFRFFETLGDGSTAHTPDMPLTVDLLPDFMYSLAKAMASDEDLTAAVRFEVTSYDTTAERIAFAAGVRYKEDNRTRYYSAQEMKVSASDGKRHDKRYHEISSWCDGTFDATYRILMKDYQTAWDSYKLEQAIRKWYSAQGMFLHYKQMKPVFEDILSREQLDYLNCAYDACQALVEAAQLRFLATRTIASYEERVAPSVVVETT